MMTMLQSTALQMIPKTPLYSIFLSTSSEGGGLGLLTNEIKVL
jgi:hypothetical protein